MAQYANYDDRELADLLRQHDHKAFNEIYQRYWKKMLLIAWNHSQDNGIAKDIVQEVFVKFMATVQRTAYRQPSGISCHSYQISGF